MMPGDMTMTRSRSEWRSVLATLAMVGLASCEALLNPTTKVSLAISHHGSRGEDGVLPNCGGDGAARIVTTDLGWEIILSEAVIVMTAAQIESCTGETFNFDLPYGPLPESQLDRDLDRIDFAMTELPEGSYCKLRVEYGRYQSALAEQAFDEPYPIQTSAPIEGLTIYLAGQAKSPTGEKVHFGFQTANTELVELDLSASENGRPFTITTKEPGGKTLTVAKTYDAFFRGLDFSDFDEAELEASLLKVLNGETYVIAGSQLY
jgi:hypothetical protein